MHVDKNLKGNIFAILSFVYWGIAPVYWQLFANTSPFVLVFNRFIWGAVILLLYMFFTRKLGLFAKHFSLRTMTLLGVQALLLLINWIAFAYSFVFNQTIQAGLGYAMNPLLNIAIAMLLFKEKLNRLEILALGIAIVSLVYLLIIARVIPSIALILCLTFACYGVLKKKSKLPSYFSLGMELLIASLLSGLFLLIHVFRPIALFQGESLPLVLFISGGLATIIPLLLYNAAVKLIPFARAAFFQFLVPTLITLVSLTVLNEEIPLLQLPGYGLMWCALMVYVVSLVKKQRKKSL